MPTAGMKQLLEGSVLAVLAAPAATSGLAASGEAMLLAKPAGPAPAAVRPPRRSQRRPRRALQPKRPKIAEKDKMLTQSTRNHPSGIPQHTLGRQSVLLPNPNLLHRKTCSLRQEG